MPHCCSVKTSRHQRARFCRLARRQLRHGRRRGAHLVSGNTGIFDAQTGAADSYVASNYLSAGFGGNVDNWLVTPLIAALTGSVVTFSTRTAGGLPGDNLELLYNNIGNGDIVSDFVSLGVISSAAYPTDWQAFNFTYGGANANVRFAFRYTVTDTSVNSNCTSASTRCRSPVFRSRERCCCSGCGPPADAADHASAPSRTTLSHFGLAGHVGRPASDPDSFKLQSRGSHDENIQHNASRGGRQHCWCARCSGDRALLGITPPINSRSPPA